MAPLTGAVNLLREFKGRNIMYYVADVNVKDLMSLDYEVLYDASKSVSDRSCGEVLRRKMRLLHTS